jgi:hypothetical protein
MNRCLTNKGESSQSHLKLCHVSGLRHRPSDRILPGPGAEVGVPGAFGFALRPSSSRESRGEVRWQPPGIERWAITGGAEGSAAIVAIPGLLWRRHVEWKDGAGGRT